MRVLLALRKASPARTSQCSRLQIPVLGGASTRGRHGSKLNPSNRVRNCVSLLGGGVESKCRGRRRCCDMKKTAVEGQQKRCVSHHAGLGVWQRSHGVCVSFWASSVLVARALDVDVRARARAAYIRRKRGRLEDRSRISDPTVAVPVRYSCKDLEILQAVLI